ncbi:MAG: ArsA family ATPase [Polyangia bacterium]|jgi:arsenite-transporting ATPase|nr:ArsA family ATPase [Polyangia bacterium]
MSQASSGDGGPLYHFFSGKGGVGKTTLAAATAVHLARKGLRVLITSTDPAHSLSDVFEQQIGHHGADLAPGLRGLELDSSARWAEATVLAEEPELAAPRRRGRVERALTDAMKMMGDAPGVDEFISLELLLETMTSDAFDTVVFDTAPTGHTLRLLLLPEMLDGWLGRVLTIKSQLSRMGRVFRKLLPQGRDGQDAPDIGEGLMSARERISRARELISNPDRTLFALVTIPEAMSVLETARTMKQLSEHHIPVGAIIANQIQPHSDTCPHCRLRREIHVKELEHLVSVSGGTPLRVVESKPRVIRGVVALAELGSELWPEGN